MIDVTLDWFELALAAEVGVRRQLESFREGRRDLYGAKSAEGGGRGRGWHLHIEGAAGELAVAKALGRFWNGSVNTFRQGGDVGAVQVRTRSRHWYDPIVRTHDRDEDYFVLVTGVAPSFRVVGWIRGADAKRPEWLRDHGGHGEAYFVPRDGLTAFRPVYTAADA